MSHKTPPTHNETNNDDDDDSDSDSDNKNNKQKGNIYIYIMYIILKALLIPDSLLCTHVDRSG